MDICFRKALFHGHGDDRLELFGDVGVLVHAGEEVGVHAVGTGVHGEGGVSAAGPSDGALVVEDRHDRVRDGVAAAESGALAVRELAVERLFDAVLFGLGEDEREFSAGFLVFRAEIDLDFFRGLRVVSGLGGTFRLLRSGVLVEDQAEVLGDERLDVVELDGLFFLRSLSFLIVVVSSGGTEAARAEDAVGEPVDLVLEFVAGALLVAEEIDGGFVFGVRESEGQAAGLVVAGDDEAVSEQERLPASR